MDDRGLCLEGSKEPRKTSVRVAYGLWGSNTAPLGHKSSAFLIEWTCAEYLSY